MRTEDGHIIQKCLDGDAAAFGLLVDKYKGSVYALAYAKLGDFHDAQDMTQEVFLKAYRKLRTLKRWDRFLSWLYAITSNSCKDFLRSKANRPDEEYISDQEQECLAKMSIDSHHEEALHQTLRDALSELPEIHRQVLSLHYLGGLSCKEIAQFLGASPHAITMRLSRARAKLRKEMLTMMRTSFDGQKLHSGFTLNIVEMIRRTHIQPNPQVPVIPIGIAAIGILTLSMLCLTAPFNQIPAIGKLVGAPIPSETRITEVGEIPVDVVVLSKSSIVSGGDGKKDLTNNFHLISGVHTADAQTQAETDTHAKDLLKLVAERYRYNWSSLKTWSGETETEGLYMRDGGKVIVKGVGKFYFDADDDTTRSDWKSIDYSSSVSNPSVEGFYPYTNKCIFRPDLKAQIGPLPLKEQQDVSGISRLKVLVIDNPQSGMQVALSDVIFPRYYFTADTADIGDTVSFLHQNFSKESMGIIRLKRVENIITLRVEKDGILNQYKFDVSKSCNLVEYFADDGRIADRIAIDWIEISGVFVPHYYSRTIYHFDGDERYVYRRNEIKFTKSKVNKPIASDVFDPENLGLSPGDTILDNRTGTQSKYVPSN